MASTPPRRAVADPLRDARRLTARDRQILTWLAEHYVLTTEQIAHALFGSHRYAQRRLALLHRIGATSRFAFARDPGSPAGAGSYRHTLGPLGVLLYPTVYTDPDNPTARPPKTLTERRARIKSRNARERFSISARSSRSKANLTGRYCSVMRNRGP